MASGEWPGSLIAEAEFVAGDVEGAFTAEVIAQVMAWRARYDIVGVFAVGEMLVEQAGIVADVLGLPYDRCAQAGLIPVAYTKGTDFRPATRGPLDQIVHWDTW